MRRIAAFCLFMLAMAQGADAQTPPVGKPWQDVTTASLERDILRLSEVSGALAFLRDLCGEADAAEWPKRMQQLLTAEGTTPDRKGRIAGAYNSGYRNYALTYRTCTPPAREASSRFIAESRRLTNAILDRYGK